VSAYYNEFDPYAAQWLRNLIAAGHIAPGDVDERSIVDVRPDDLRGYTQCHFFAGIGGWSCALRLAGWPDDRPVWTGSCPCQPFSAAGKRKAGADERHLWPVWFRLIRECGPRRVFGEQVEAAVGLGWLDRVFADLEGEAYACGAVVLGAHSVGAPHIRQRLWWVADAGNERRTGLDPLLREEAAGRFSRNLPEAAGRGATGRMADADGGLACDRDIQRSGQHGQQPQDGGAVGRMGDAGCYDVGRLGGSASGAEAEGASSGQVNGLGCVVPGSAGAAGFWSRFDLIPCADGKARRAGPGIQPLAHGVSARVGKLRAAGNAIVPQVAAEFIRAAMTNPRRISPDASSLRERRQLAGGRGAPGLLPRVS
jgi:DNA (cytosine-5)-methyltransferase 1